MGRKWLEKGIFLVILVCAGGFLHCEAYAEEKVEGQQPVPEAVRRAATEYGNGSEPSHIEQETEEGHIFYEAEFEEEGAERGIKMDEEGRIIEEERELPVSDLPSAALESLKAQHPEAEIEEVELVTRTYYEVELEKDGKGVALMILQNGFVLDPPSAHEADDTSEEEGEDEDEEESEVSWEDLPEAVQKVFLSHRDGSKPEEFERSQTGDRVLYEAEYAEENGVKHEIKVDASGEVIEVEDEMPASQLPKEILSQIESLHPGAEIEEVALKQSTYYEVEIEIGEEESEIRVLGNGLILGAEEGE